MKPKRNPFEHRHPDAKDGLEFEPFHYIHKGAYCEHCNQRKPRNHLPQRKGWMCGECLKEKTK